MSESLLWNVRPSTTGRQIILFPFLGGFGASFNRLVRELGGDWDIWTVNPPGHGPSDMPPQPRLRALVGAYLTALRPVLRPDALVFGHSMGGVVAYHVLSALADDPSLGWRRPTDLVLSATAAPRDLRVDGFSSMPEANLLAHLRRFGALSDEVVNDRELVALFLPAFRADYCVLAEARRIPPIPLDVRTQLVLAACDEHTPPGTALAWQDYIATPILTHVLPGADHMYVLNEVAVLDGILNGASVARV